MFNAKIEKERILFYGSTSRFFAEILSTLVPTKQVLTQCRFSFYLTNLSAMLSRHKQYLLSSTIRLILYWVFAPSIKLKLPQRRALTTYITTRVTQLANQNLSLTILQFLSYQDLSFLQVQVETKSTKMKSTKPRSNKSNHRKPTNSRKAKFQSKTKSENKSSFIIKKDSNFN